LVEFDESLACDDDRDPAVWDVQRSRDGTVLTWSRCAGEDPQITEFDMDTPFADGRLRTEVGPVDEDGVEMDLFGGSISEGTDGSFLVSQTDLYCGYAAVVREDGRSEPLEARFGKGSGSRDNASSLQRNGTSDDPDCGDGGVVDEFTVSHAGDLVAFVGTPGSVPRGASGPDYRLWTMPYPSGEVEELASFRTPKSVEFSPDDTMLLVGHDEGVSVYDLEGRELERWSGEDCYASWSPDARQIVAACSRVVREADIDIGPAEFVTEVYVVEAPATVVGES